MQTDVTDEISLRDVYLILKKYSRFILGCTIGAAGIALIASFVLPKSFSSQATLNIAIGADRAEFKGAPSAVGLAQGFIQQVEKESLTNELKEERLENIFKAKYDDKKALLNLTAVGESPEQALTRAGRIETSFRDYAEKQVSGAVRTNLEGSLAQSKIDLASSSENLKRLEPLLKTTPRSQIDGVSAAALESNGVDPQLARTSNAAFVNLALQVTQLKAGVVAIQSRIISLEGILKNATAFKGLLGQGFQIQTLAVPSLPLTHDSPRAGIITALAAVAGLLLGLVGAFILEALRPETAQNKINPSRNELTRGNTESPRVNPGD